jgi:hypothetical protein
MTNVSTKIHVAVQPSNISRTVSLFTKDRTHICIFLVCVVDFEGYYMELLLHFRIETEVQMTSDNTYFLPSS